MKAAAGVLVLLCLGTVPHAASAAAKQAAPTCPAFMDAFIKATAGHRATFERPLTITRGFFGDAAGVEVRVLTTADNVDGTLKCRGDEFRRFEVRVAVPVADRTNADFKLYQEAALTAAFAWDRAKVQTVVGAMSSDAAEYLRASVQRGDTYVSGKVEYHQGQTLDLGVIWTDTDRTFIITSQSDE